MNYQMISQNMKNYQSKYMTFDQQTKLKLIKKLRSRVMKAIDRRYPEIRKQVSKELDLLEYKEVYKK